jgi:cation:H+ antiporter
VPPSVILWDLPFKLVVGVAALGYAFVLRDGTVGRRDGIYLVLVYLVYVSGRFVLFSA